MNVHRSRLISRIVCLAFLSICFTSRLQAQTGKFFFSLSGIYDDDEFKEGSSRLHATSLMTVLSAGFAQNPGWFLGIRYFQFHRDDKDERANSSGFIIKSLGPMLGFFHDSGFFGNLTYLLAPTKEQDVASGGGTASGEFKGGAGYIVDVGKIWMLGSSIGASLGMSYTKIDYKTLETPSAGETSLNGTWYDKFIYPQLGISLFF